MAEKRLNANELADHIRLTKRQVQNLVEQHSLPKHGHGKDAYYLWSEVLPWYLDYKQRQWQARQQSEPEDSDINAATLRKIVAEAGIKELQLAQKRGQVVAISDVQSTLEQHNTIVKQRLLSIPGKLTPRLAATSDKRKVKTLLEDELVAALSELAQKAGDVDLPEPTQDARCAGCRFWDGRRGAHEGECTRPQEEESSVRVIFNDGVITGALITLPTFYCAHFESRERG